MLAAIRTLAPARSPLPPETLLAAGVGLVLSLLIIPMPSPLLDGLLAANIVIGALILVSVLLSERPLAMSSFPTILVLTTLFRLGLNVSTTRMILSEGEAGAVVAAFGQFVARGDVLMGLVVFVILTLVQLMVIGKGAERVAEVGARFTLDAMPGKQMSIDAALRNGALTEADAEERRTDLGRESQFYGAMDGAMKFVKGDAIVGLIVTVVNLVAGLCIGILRFDMSPAEAAETFAILTIGDGLVSQIPSLLIALASGILTTRVASKVPTHDLSAVLGQELFGSPKVLTLVAAFAGMMALVPGLPTLPFFVLAGGLGLVAFARRPGRSPRAGATELRTDDAFAEKLEQRRKSAAAQKAVSDQMAPTVPLIGIDLGSDLSTALGFGHGDDDKAELIARWIPDVRDACFGESGVRLPGVRVRSAVAGVPPNVAIFKVKDVPVDAHAIPLGQALCLATPEQVKRLGVIAEPTTNPLNEAPACLVPAELAETLAKSGLSVWSTAGIISLHLLRTARRHLEELVGLQETVDAVKRLERVCPDIVKELIPRVVTTAQLRDVLRQLVRERVSIRDLKTILEALGEVGDRSLDRIQLIEHVRSALQLQITHGLAGYERRIGVIVVDEEVEDAIRDAVVEGPGCAFLALDPELRRRVLDHLGALLEPLRSINYACAVLTHAELRFFLRELIATRFPETPVVSYRDLSDDLVLQPLGRLRVEAPRPRLVG